MIKIKDLEIKFHNEVFVEKTDIFFPTGNVTAIVGESGSGKTSILDKISLSVDDEIIQFETEFKDEKENLLRNRIFYIHQDPLFLDDLSCIEHIRLFSKINNKSISNQEIVAILDKVGLVLDKNKYPQNLSGGEKQRFAIALALVKDADIVICDEITSSLDEINGQAIIQLLISLARSGKTVIISSHNKELYQQCDLIYEIKEKRIQLLKEEIFKTEVPLIDKKLNKITFGDSIKLFFNRLKKQTMNFYTYVFILSMMISICCIGTFLGRQYSMQAQAITKLFDANMSYVYEDVGVNAYSEYASSIKETDIEKISKLEGIEKVYQNIMFTWPSGVNLFNNPTETIENNDKIFQITTLNNTREVVINNSVSESVYPYYNNQNMDYSCVQVNQNVENGIYLRSDIARKFNIENLDSPVEITFEVYVPVARMTEKKYSGRAVYKLVEIKKEVRGILDPSYSQYNGNIIYMDYDEMNTIYIQAKDNVTLIDGLIDFQPNLLAIFTKDNIKLEDVSSKIKTINSKYVVYNFRDSLNKGMTPILNNEKYILTYTLALIGATIIVSVVYGAFNGKRLKKEKQIFINFGYTISEIRKLMVANVFCNSLVLFATSSILSLVFVFILGNKKLIYLNQYTITLSYLCGFLLIILCLFCSYGCYFKTLWRGKKK